MGRKRKYETNAERHAAYRKRNKEKGKFAYLFIPNKIAKIKDFKPSLLVERFDEIETALKNEREIMDHNVKLLQTDIKNKDKQIFDLEQKNREAGQEIADKVHNILQEQANHVFILIHRLAKEVKTTAGLINDTVSALECKPAVKEHLLVMKDSLDKARTAVVKELDVTELLISDRLVAIEVFDSHTLPPNFLVKSIEPSP